MLPISEKLKVLSMHVESGIICSLRYPLEILEHIAVGKGISFRVTTP